MEVQHFADCIQKGTTPITDGQAGLRVVSVLKPRRAPSESGADRFDVVPFCCPCYGGIRTGKTFHECSRFSGSKLQYAAIKNEVLRAVGDVLESSHFVFGKEVAAFEDEFATFCGAQYGVAVNTGTSALHLALLAAGVGTATRDHGSMHVCRHCGRRGLYRRDTSFCRC